MRRLDVLLALLLMPSTAIAQTTLFELTSGEPDDDFGSSIANVGDVDRDGFDDLGVGAPESDLGGVDAGAVYVYSGRTGLQLHLFLGTKDIELGSSLCAAGDVDQDGFADVLIGAPWNGNGRGIIYSGLTGKVIRSHVGTEPGDGFGNVVGNVGDIDADGVDDYAVSAAPEPFIDYVRVYSGRSGSFLRTHVSPLRFGGTFIGRAFLALVDLDEDGHGDYAIGEPADTGLGGAAGDSWVWVHSGQTGQILFNLTGSTTSIDLLGSSLASPGDLDGDGKSDVWVGASVGGYARLYGGITGTNIIQEHHGRGFFGAAVACADVDGDGRRDLLVGSPFRDSPALTNVGAVEVFSSTSGALLLELEGSAASERMGTSLADLGDLTGDGSEEFAVGAWNGYVRVVSPVDQSLSSPQPHPLVSTSTGGAVDFELDTRPVLGSLFYLLLGSASGTSPSVPLAPGVALPLVPDAYTQAILQSLGSPAFDGFFGVLDGSGGGSARLDLAGGVDPALIGITLHHAFAVFGPTGSAVFASNAVASTMIPDPLEVPSCFFLAPPLEKAGNYLVFDGSTGVDPNGSSVVHTWEFGDGSSATGAVVSHVYASQGLYEVEHRVEDEDENASACSVDVEVDSCVEVTPFLGSWYFDASGPGEDLVEHYAWDFGDGSSIQTDFSTVFHPYSQLGTFTVTLTRVFHDGATSTCSQSVVVLPTIPATCNIAVTPFFGTWFFDASGPGDGFIEQYAWDFGDGTSAVTDFANITHNYSGPGTFTVTLTVTYSHEAPTSTCSLIVVVP